MPSSSMSLFLLFVSLLLLLLCGMGVTGQTYTVTTYAGSGTASSSDGLGTLASFNKPSDLAFDYSSATSSPSYGVLYVADSSGQRIRKITPNRQVTTLAGSGTAGSANGQGTYASFSTPYGIDVDAQSNILVAEYGNSLLRKITPLGAVSTFVGSGVLNTPQGLSLDPSTGQIYLADYTNHLVRKITSAGVVSTFAGSGSPTFAEGTGGASSFNYPADTSFDTALNIVYVADSYNHRIRKITPASVVSTVAGTGANSFVEGSVTSAAFSFPSGVVFDGMGSIYVTDNGNNRVRRIMDGMTTTVVGTGTAGFANGPGTAALISAPWRLALDSSGHMYLTDFNNHRIRKILVCKNGAMFDSGAQGCVCTAGSEMQINGTCTQCAGGYFQAVAGSQSCQQCAAGSESSADSTACVGCVVGKYRSLGMPGCEYCPLGSDVNLNQTACTACTYGRVRSSLLSLACSDCSVGFEAASNKSLCVACSAGMYRPSIDFLKCIPCPMFANCSATALTACQTGYKISATGDSCEQCPIGTQSSGDSLSCVPCTLGTNYRSSLSQSNCQSCPPNSVCSTASSFTCAAGYEPNALQTGCQICLDGYSKSANGACVQCSLGTESSTDKLSCIACSGGKYRPTTAVNTCMPCPQNGACSASSLTCNSGFQLNSAGDGCDQCPVGQQSNTWFTACVSCTAGTNYRSLLSQSACLACPANSACIATGFTCNAG